MMKGADSRYPLGLTMLRLWGAELPSGDVGEGDCNLPLSHGQSPAPSGQRMALGLMAPSVGLVLAPLTPSLATAAARLKMPAHDILTGRIAEGGWSLGLRRERRGLGPAIFLASGIRIFDLEFCHPRRRVRPRTVSQTPKTLWGTVSGRKRTLRFRFVFYPSAHPSLLHSH